MEDERCYEACINGHGEELFSLLGRNPAYTNQILFASGGSYHLGGGLAARRQFTPLMLAAREGHADIVKQLLETKLFQESSSKAQTEMPINVRDQENEAKTVFGRTAIYFAARNGHATPVDLLIEHKAAIDTPDSNGTTPLFAAVECDRTKENEWRETRVAELLAKLQVKPHDADDALAEAKELARTGDKAKEVRVFELEEVVHLLGFPIMDELANHRRVVEALLKAGADPNLRTNDGRLPLGVVRDEQMLFKLLQAGARITQAEASSLVSHWGEITIAEIVLQIDNSEHVQLQNQLQEQLKSRKGRSDRERITNELADVERLLEHLHENLACVTGWLQSRQTQLDKALETVSPSGDGQAGAPLIQFAKKGDGGVEMQTAEAALDFQLRSLAGKCQQTWSSSAEEHSPVRPVRVMCPLAGANPRGVMFNITSDKVTFGDLLAEALLFWKVKASENDDYMLVSTDFFSFPLDASVLFTFDGVQRGHPGGRHLGVSRAMVCLLVKADYCLALNPSEWTEESMDVVHRHRELQQYAAPNPDLASLQPHDDGGAHASTDRPLNGVALNGGALNRGAEIEMTLIVNPNDDPSDALVAEGGGDDGEVGWSVQVQSEPEEEVIMYPETEEDQLQALRDKRRNDAAAAEDQMQLNRQREQQQRDDNRKFMARERTRIIARRKPWRADSYRVTMLNLKLCYVPVILLLFLYRFSEFAKIRERGEHTRAVEHTLGVHPSCYPPLDFEHDDDHKHPWCSFAKASPALSEVQTKDDVWDYLRQTLKDRIFPYNENTAPIDPKTNKRLDVCTYTGRKASPNQFYRHNIMVGGIEIIQFRPYNDTQHDDNTTTEVFAPKEAQPDPPPGPQSCFNRGLVYCPKNSSNTADRNSCLNSCLTCTKFNSAPPKTDPRFGGPNDNTCQNTTSAQTCFDNNKLLCRTKLNTRLDTCVPKCSECDEYPLDPIPSTTPKSVNGLVNPLNGKDADNTCEERPSAEVCYALSTEEQLQYFCIGDVSCYKVKCTLCPGYPITPLITSSSISDEYQCGTADESGEQCGVAPYDLDTPFYCPEFTLNKVYKKRCIKDCRLCTGFTVPPVLGSKLCQLGNQDTCKALGERTNPPTKLLLCPMDAADNAGRCMASCTSCTGFRNNPFDFQNPPGVEKGPVPVKFQRCFGPYEMFECQIPDANKQTYDLAINGADSLTIKADNRGAFNLQTCYDLCNVEPLCGGFVRERKLAEDGSGLSGDIVCQWIHVMKGSVAGDVGKFPGSYTMVPNRYTLAGSEETVDTPDTICKKTFYQKRPGRGDEGGLCTDDNEEILNWYKSVCPNEDGNKCQQAPRTCSDVVCGRGVNIENCGKVALNFPKANLANCGRFLPANENFDGEVDDFSLADYAKKDRYAFVGTVCCSICAGEHIPEFVPSSEYIKKPGVVRVSQSKACGILRSPTSRSTTYHLCPTGKGIGKCVESCEASCPGYPLGNSLNCERERFLCVAQNEASCALGATVVGENRPPLKKMFKSSHLCPPKGTERPFATCVPDCADCGGFSVNPAGHGIPWTGVCKHNTCSVASPSACMNDKSSPGKYTPLVCPQIRKVCCDPSNCVCNGEPQSGFLTPCSDECCALTQTLLNGDPELRRKCIEEQEITCEVKDSEIFKISCKDETCNDGCTACTGFNVDPLKLKYVPKCAPIEPGPVPMPKGYNDQGPYLPCKVPSTDNKKEDGTKDGMVCVGVILMLNEVTGKTRSEVTCVGLKYAKDNPKDEKNNWCLRMPENPSHFDCEDKWYCTNIGCEQEIKRKSLEESPTPPYIWDDTKTPPAFDTNKQAFEPYIDFKDRNKCMPTTDLYCFNQEPEALYLCDPGIASERRCMADNCFQCPGYASTPTGTVADHNTCEAKDNDENCFDEDDEFYCPADPSILGSKGECMTSCKLCHSLTAGPRLEDPHFSTGDTIGNKCTQPNSAADCFTLKAQFYCPINALDNAGSCVANDCSTCFGYIKTPLGKSTATNTCQETLPITCWKNAQNMRKDKSLPFHCPVTSINTLSRGTCVEDCDQCAPFTENPYDPLESVSSAGPHSCTTTLAKKAYEVNDTAYRFNEGVDDFVAEFDVVTEALINRENLWTEVAGNEKRMRYGFTLQGACIDYNGKRWAGDLERLQAGGWWDQHTEQVVVRMLYYNVDMKIFTTAYVYFNQTAAGGIVAWADIKSLDYKTQHENPIDYAVAVLLAIYLSVQAYARLRQLMMEAREAGVHTANRLCGELLCHSMRFVYLWCVCGAMVATLSAWYLRWLAVSETAANATWTKLDQDMRCVPCQLKLAGRANIIEQPINCEKTYKFDNDNKTTECNITCLNSEGDHNPNITCFEINDNTYTGSLHVNAIHELIYLWENALWLDCVAFMLLVLSYLQVLGLYLPFRDLGDMCLKAASAVLMILMWYGCMIIAFAFCGCIMFPRDEDFATLLRGVRTCLLIAVGDNRIDMPSDNQSGMHIRIMTSSFLAALGVTHLYVLAAMFMAFASAVRDHDAAKFSDGDLDKYYSTHECCQCRFPECDDNVEHLERELKRLKRQSDNRKKNQ